jgi:thioredoxin-like negative regulator of GroEL
MIAVVIAGLTALDLSLEQAQRTELQGEASNLYKQGSRLLAEGKPALAVEPLRHAHMLERQNQDYELDLISALAGSGKTAEGRQLLDDALDREPNDGRTNLIAARLMVETQKTAEADAYYHRAIYGDWGKDQATQSLAGRMELIHWLAKNGRKQELLSELLPVEDEAAKDPKLLGQVAHYFLTAGSPARVADAFQRLIQSDANNADGYIGLAESNLQRSEYRPALAAFLQAYRHKPNDSEIRRRMEFASMMAGLDPTLRQLSSAEKYQRSTRILQMTDDALARCTGQLSTSTPVKPPAHVTNEMAEEQLGIAERLWQTRIQRCGPSTSPDEEALRLIMAKLAQ